MTDIATDTVESSGALFGCPLQVRGAHQVLFVPRDRYLEVVEAANEFGYNVCIDVTCVDYLAAPDARVLPDGVSAERFEVVTNLLSHAHKQRLRLRVQVPGNDPVVPTVFGLYPGSEAMEREVYDMFGVRFSGHPDLTRILMPEDWEGHPLRKDYSQGRIPVQFKFPEGEYSAEDRP